MEEKSQCLTCCLALCAFVSTARHALLYTPMALPKLMSVSRGAFITVLDMGMKIACQFPV